MKQVIRDLILKSIETLQEKTALPADLSDEIRVSACKDSAHGDYASNIALILAKKASKPPRELAEMIKNALPTSDFVQKVSVAGAGFINFSLSDHCLEQVVNTVLTQGQAYGQSTIGNNQRIHIEYVSANPTGPLHVGHGRGAAFGATVANLLEACGYQVHREYYVNDAGRQMQILALSVWLRYLEIHAENVPFPEQGYRGEYVIDIAKKLSEKYGSRFHHTQESFPDRSNIEDADQRIDQWVIDAKAILGEDDFNIIFELALDEVLTDIRDDLHEFGVDYQAWFKESSLFADGLIEASLQLLEKQGHVFEKDGAKWFKATEFGDEKDRVLVRSNGVTTYFASDVAYHLYKYREGYHKIIDVFGADHHGYLSRIQGFLKALGEDPQKIKTLMVQFAILYRGKTRVSMSTRGGQFVTLRELRNEVGNDAARFFYIMRRCDQHLDFDLELAKSQSSDNPVYYIQYAHARICSVWEQLQSSEQTWDKSVGLGYLSLLTTVHEKNLIRLLLHYPEIIEAGGLNHEPHTLAHYLLNMANTFHSYYNSEKFLVEQNALRNARLCLVRAIQQTLVNGLTLLGISTPKKM